jgi:hypothetical protein
MGVALAERTNSRLSSGVDMPLLNLELISLCQCHSHNFACTPAYRVCALVNVACALVDLANLNNQM